MFVPLSREEIERLRLTPEEIEWARTLFFFHDAGCCSPFRNVLVATGGVHSVGLRVWLFQCHQQGMCWPGCRWCQECPGYDRGGKAPPCCDRAGQYNGYGSDGPLLFECPKHCSCHD